MHQDDTKTMRTNNNNPQTTDGFMEPSKGNSGDKNEKNNTLSAIAASLACFATLSAGYTFFTNSITQNEETRFDQTPTHTTSISATRPTQSEANITTGNNQPQDPTTQPTEHSEDGDTNIPSNKGLYGFTSERLLTEDDLSNMTNNELKIMRNEIYARHGYIFKTKRMKEYFSTQPWYEGIYDDVSSMLSEIEVKNVEFIKRHE